MSGWPYKTVMLESRGALAKKVISFVCLIPVRLYISSSMAVKYLVSEFWLD